MIAVTFALPQESKDLRRELQEVRIVGKGQAGDVFTGLLRGAPIVLVHTGVGPRAALSATRNLLERFQPKLLISSGFAGGLSDELEVGDVVFDPRATQLAMARAARLFVGRIATSARALESPANKAAFRKETGAVAVDMESSAIAEACGGTATPFVCMRGVSDAAADPLPVPMAHWFDLDGQRPRPLGLLRFLAAHPGRIIRFARFLSGLPKARKAMTAAIVAFVENCGLAGEVVVRTTVESD
jgi:adenosylhomocysteine nucleosidase